MSNPPFTTFPRWLRAVARPLGAALLSVLPLATASGQCSLVEVAQLIAANPGGSDHAGYSVAISGDTAVVGAPQRTHGGMSQAGSAFVFVRTGGVWSWQAELTAADAAAHDQFGVSVAVSGDTVVVGAWQDDHVGGTLDGSAYVFVRSGTVWTQQARLTASDAAPNDQFGIAVAVSGDTALIGAWFDDVPGQGDQGSAYVFVRSGTVWTEQQKLNSPQTPRGDRFGCAVALAGDTAVVGAYQEDRTAGFDEGAAYVFVRTGTLWTVQARLLASDAAQSDRLGGSVALSGDTVLAGAGGDDHPGGLQQGSAYVFVRPAGGWSNMFETAKLTASDGATDDFFGMVALSGDRALVGAYGDDRPGLTNAGAAYVFVRPPGGWQSATETAKLTASNAGGADLFGYGVALSSDTALVGADFSGPPALPQRGTVYVFTPGPVPANDACLGAIPLALGSNGPFRNGCATTSSPWPCGTGGSDVWFSFSAVSTAPHTFRTCGADFDTTIEVLLGGCGVLVSLGCNDNSCQTAAAVTVPLINRNVYLVRVGGAGGVQGSFPLEVLVGTGLGTIGAGTPGCGPTTISVTGSANIGSAVTTTLGNVTGIPFIGIGFAPFPSFPFCGCTLGHGWQSSTFGSSHVFNIPPNAAYIGAQVGIQGLDLFGTGGCPNPMLAMTATAIVTIG